MRYAGLTRQPGGCSETSLGGQGQTLRGYCLRLVSEGAFSIGMARARARQRPEQQHPRVLRVVASWKLTPPVLPSWLLKCRIRYESNEESHVGSDRADQ